MAAVLVWASAAATAAEAPLSVIDWLSDSIAAPAPPASVPGRTIPGSATAPAVDTMPLRSLLPDGVGLITARDARLPIDLWGVSDSAELAALLRAEPLDLLPSIRMLLRRVLLAELTPPADADQTGALLLARIDKLLALGALDEASAILDLAGTASTELFRRRFDVSLLTGAEERACQELKTDPTISPTYPARIFCMARLGDWHTAAVTLETASALGLLSEEDDLLLAFFLHPELTEEADPLPPPARPTPLIFRLYEAVGEPLPTGPLPIAFAHADLRTSVGWKAQIDAAERLAKIGAIDANRLLGLYTDRRPAASGGVWDRVSAVQKLERALDSGDGAAASPALLMAYERMANAGLEPVFATLFADRLLAADLTPEARALAFRLGLLTSGFEAVASEHTPTDAPERFLAAIATGAAGTVATDQPIERALGAGFATTGAPERYRTLLDGNRRGEALLRALALFGSGAAGNLDDLRSAIALLRALGFETTARRAAIELLVLGARA